MDNLQNLRLTKIAEINRLFPIIFSNFNKDEANIWNEIPRIVKVFSLINEIRMMNEDEFTKYLNGEGEYGDTNTRIKYDFSNEFLASLTYSPFSQKQFMGKMGIDNWFPKFVQIIKATKDFVFFTYVYYSIYDTFSENSRDNELKVKSITSLIPQNAKLLEIGPGTGPLLRRLLKKGYNAYALELHKPMIRELLKRCPEAKGRVMNGDFFEYTLGQNDYNLIFIESGFFLFTLIGNKLFFEIYSDINWDKVNKGLLHIFNYLKEGGIFLIGIQGLMKKVPIGDHLYFSMKRTQKEDHAERTLTYYRKKGIFAKKEILYTSNQKKPTMPYREFISLATRIGFTKVGISDDHQWVILKK